MDSRRASSTQIISWMVSLNSIDICFHKILILPRILNSDCAIIEKPKKFIWVSLLTHSIVSMLYSRFLFEMVGFKFITFSYLTLIYHFVNYLLFIIVFFIINHIKCSQRTKHICILASIWCLLQIFSLMFLILSICKCTFKDFFDAPPFAIVAFFM